MNSNKKSIKSEVVLQSLFEEDSDENQSYLSPLPKKRDFEDVYKSAMLSKDQSPIFLEQFERRLKNSFSDHVKKDPLRHMKPSRQQGIEHLRPKCIDASE